MPTQSNRVARFVPPETPPPALGDTAQVSNVVQFATVWGAGGGAAGVPEAPQDGDAYFRRNAAWVNAIDVGVF